MTEDKQLIEAAKRGQTWAFDELMQRYYSTIRRIVRCFASIEEDVNDLVQETFITAYDHLHQLDDPEKFTAWIGAIARNECRMWLRHRLSQPALLPLDSEDIFVCTYDAEAAREVKRRSAIREAIFDAMAALNHQQHSVVRMHYFEGYDYRETAELLSVPVTIVRGRLDRARNILRKELEDIMVLHKKWKLHKRDLDTLRLAVRFVRAESANPLGNIYFTGECGFVCIDGCRLLHYGSSSLKSTPAVLMDADLSRKLQEKPDICNASLTFDEKKVILQLSDGNKIEAAFAEGDYPDWRIVLPEEWQVSIKAKSGHWLQALELLEKQREARLIETDPAWPKRLLMVLSPEEKRIVLRQGQDPVDSDDLAREISVWFPADYFVDGPDMTIAFNADYLKDAVSALNLQPEEIVELKLNRPDPMPGPILIKPSDVEDIWVLTMPMAGTTHRCPEHEIAARS